MSSACHVCGEPLLWTKTKAGRWMAVESTPTEYGNVRLGDGDAPLAVMLDDIGTMSALAEGVKLYRAHPWPCHRDKFPKGV